MGAAFKLRWTRAPKNACPFGDCNFWARPYDNGDWDTATFYHEPLMRSQDNSGGPVRSEAHAGFVSDLNNSNPYQCSLYSVGIFTKQKLYSALKCTPKER